MKVMHLKHRTSVQNTRKKTTKSINKKNKKKQIEKVKYTQVALACDRGL